MSFKRLSPESVEVFSVVLHPKRRYKARANYLVANTESEGDSGVPANAILTQAGDPILTQAGDYLVTES